MGLLTRKIEWLRPFIVSMIELSECDKIHTFSIGFHRISNQHPMPVNKNANIVNKLLHRKLSHQYRVE